MNPIYFLLHWMSNYLNPILAIIILTIIIKFFCFPIYALRYKNSCLKERVRKYISSIEKKEERKKKKKQLYDNLNVKKWSFSFALFMIEISIIILFLRAINSIDANIYWFNISFVDTTNILSYIYLLILIVVETLGLTKTSSKLEMIIQLIFSILIIVLMYETSKTVISGVIIYWCVSSLYNFIIKKIFLEKVIKQKIDEQYSISNFTIIDRNFEEG